MADLNALYEQYLGRAPDPSGIATWSGQDESSIIAGILGSQEYANRQASGGGGDSGGGGISPSTSTDINALYQQYLGRNVDPTGAATWAGQSPEAIIAGIKGSPEYQASHGGGNAQDLANTVFNLYATNQNYDQQLNQLNSLAQTDPKAFYEARIGLLGKQMGWQIGQNTGDRNSVYQNELNSLIPGALASGMTQDQINNLISQNTQSASQQNQARIAADAASGAGSGWVNQNVPGGWATLGALGAAGIAAPFALGAFGAGEAGALTVPEILSSTGFVPAAGSGASFGIIPGAAYTTGALAGANTLMGPTYGELGYTGLEAGQMGPTYQELGYTGLNNAEAIAAADAAAAAYSANNLPSWLSDLAKSFGSSGATGLSSALRQGAASGLAPALGKLAQGQTGYGMEIPGIVRTNQNPFFNTPQAPIQTPQKTELSSLPDLLRQKSSWQT